MSFKAGSLLLSLMLTFVHTEGLILSIDRTHDGPYCGQLQCHADEGTISANVLSVIGMTIYDITRTNTPLKLASVSAFTPGVIVEPTKVNVINATGTISKNQASLVLGLLSNTDCSYVSFQCELDFVNSNGQSDVIRETLDPPSDNATILYILSQMSAQMQAQTEAMNREFDRFERLLNSSCIGKDGHANDASGTGIDKPQHACYRGMPSTHPREKFLLWNPIVTLCDTQTDGGGWVVIQRRTQGDVNFFRSWIDYKNGFGTADTDFWIGNDVIHNLTSQGYNELRIEFEHDGQAYFGQYANFSLASEQSKYRIAIGGISGTIYDYMNENTGHYFSTYDRDNDGTVVGNCAQDDRAGWWYMNCGHTNLNGVWGTDDGTAGVYWGDMNLLTNTEMKVRHT